MQMSEEHDRPYHDADLGTTGEAAAVNDQSADGALSAHRDILTKLLALLAVDEKNRKILFGWFDERTRVKDHQEDPGAVPQGAFAEQEARAREFRIIADDMRVLAEFDSKSGTGG